MWWVRAKLLSHVWLFATLWTVCPWDSSGKNTGVGCHALLHEIFLTQGLNPCLLHFLHWQAGYRQVPKNDWAGAYVKPAFLFYGLKVKKKKVLFYSTSLFYLFCPHWYFEQVQVSVRGERRWQTFCSSPCTISKKQNWAQKMSWHFWSFHSAFIFWECH